MNPLSNQLIALLLILINVKVRAGMKSEIDDVLFYDPCSFPDFSDELRCGIYDPLLLKHSFVCDPFGSMSVSELRLIGSTLEAITISNSKESHCTCSVGSCSYKYGFAFITRLEPLPNRTIDTYDAEYCPHTAKPSITARSLQADEVFSFSQNYARLIRERNFNIGVCGEEILILVVKEVPTGMFSQSSGAENDYFYKPRIFVSFGALIMERFGVNDFIIEPLQEIVNQENSRLQNGFPIVQVLSSFATRMDEILKESMQSQQMPQVKNHVPKWAWISFGICGISLAIMVVILYLLRSQTRRSTFRGKSMSDQRKYKAGFVGEDSQPATYANLLSQMMNKQPQSVSQQQVV